MVLQGKPGEGRPTHSVTAMRSYRLVFVGGVHGVGKTSACRVLAKTFGADHVAASQLISNARAASSKLVASVDENQQQLLDGLSSLTPTAPVLLLDGHFCLLDRSGVTGVPVEVFARMAPDAVLVLTDDPAVISRRLLLRDGHSLPPQLVEELQNQEVAAAASVSASLGVPFLRLPSGLSATAEEFVREALSRQASTAQG